MTQVFWGLEKTELKVFHSEILVQLRKRDLEDKDLSTEIID
jgi:hypothetical protein